MAGKTWSLILSDALAGAADRNALGTSTVGGVVIDLNLDTARR